MAFFNAKTKDAELTIPLAVGQKFNRIMRKTPPFHPDWIDRPVDVAALSVAGELASLLKKAGFGQLTLLCRGEEQKLRRDEAGDGAFGAKRRKKNVGKKTTLHYPHWGVDILTRKGQEIYAPFSGTVVKTGNAYEGNDKLGALHIKPDGFKNVKVKLLYAGHTLKPRQRVEHGDLIGHAQDLQLKLPPHRKMKNHAHLEILVKHGRQWLPANPTDFINWTRPAYPARRHPQGESHEAR